MLEINEVLGRFEGVRQTNGNQWMARCPCHDDRVQSLSIAVGSGGTILMDCHAGCRFEDIIAAVGLSVGDVTAESRRRPRTGFDYLNIAATYDYGNGTRKMRDVFKNFTWQHLEGGIWVPGRGDAPHRLYRSGEEQETVYVVEGEKDADNLSRAGLFCVSGENGAGSGGRKWFDEYTEELAGRKLVILSDNDDVGRGYAAAVAEKLYGRAQSVRLPDLRQAWDELPEKGDISDMLLVLGEEETLKRLGELVSSCPEWSPSLPGTEECLSADDAAEEELQQGQCSPEQVMKLLRRDPANPSRPMQTMENIKLILRYDSRFADIRFNLMRGFPEKLRDGRRQEWTDADDAAYMSYVESVYGIFNKVKADMAFTEFQHEREYHPVQELIKSLVWDGTPRVEELLIKWMRCEDNPYSRECSRLLFAGGIHRAFEPGCQFDVTVVLRGVQGGGKSTLCRCLALEPDFYSSAKTISGQKGWEAIQGKWIVEIEELLAVIANEKSGQKPEEKAKAFLTGQSDYYRAPYERRSTDHPRHCIFIGTTNRDEFLTDKTGNRRWYPLNCRYADNVPDAQRYGCLLKENSGELLEDIRQCWAEMYDAYLRHDSFAVPAPRPGLLNEIYRHQSMAEVDDWRVGVIERYLEKSNKDRVCVKELWDLALHAGESFVPDMTKRDSREIGEILRGKLGWTRGANLRFGEYGTQMSYCRPILYPILDEDTSDLPF